MSILKSLRPRKRALVALAALATSLGAVTVGGAIGAPTASAARCATAGHAYLTQPGRVIFSGFEGNQQFGVPTVTYAQGTQSFRLGGNGISPGSGVDFFVFDRNTGAQVGFVPGRPAQYYTTTARSNCVVNENGPFIFTLPPGNYRIAGELLPRQQLPARQRRRRQPGRRCRRHPRHRLRCASSTRAQGQRGLHLDSG